MPIHPSPSSETTNPCSPSRRCSIGLPSSCVNRCESLQSIYDGLLPQSVNALFHLNACNDRNFWLPLAGNDLSAESLATTFPILEGGSQLPPSKKLPARNLK